MTRARGVLDSRDDERPPAQTSWAPIVWFVVLAYLFSWSYWLPLLLSGTTVDPGMGWPSHLPGLFGPALAAVVVTAVTGRGRGLAELFSRIIRWRVGWIWYAVIGATLLLAALPLATGASLAESLRYSGAPDLGFAVLIYVVATCFGEEIGWRGFLADRLLQRQSLGRTALIVWPIWATWHLPMFWVVGNFRDFGVVGTVGWIVGIGFGSVLLTWLYQSASFSILIVALWHAAYNVATATEAASSTAAVASVVVIVAAVVILRRPAAWVAPR